MCKVMWIPKHSPWTTAKAKMPPVLVPATQSNISLIGRPASFSKAISIWIRTNPLIPPPSKHSKLFVLLTQKWQRMFASNSKWKQKLMRAIKKSSQHWWSKTRVFYYNKACFCLGTWFCGGHCWTTVPLFILLHNHKIIIKKTQNKPFVMITFISQSHTFWFQFFGRPLRCILGSWQRWQPLHAQGRQILPASQREMRRHLPNLK